MFIWSFGPLIRDNTNSDLDPLIRVCNVIAFWSPVDVLGYCYTYPRFYILNYTIYFGDPEPCMCCMVSKALEVAVPRPCSPGVCGRLEIRHVPGGHLLHEICSSRLTDALIMTELNLILKLILGFPEKA